MLAFAGQSQATECIDPGTRPLEEQAIAVWQGYSSNGELQPAIKGYRSIIDRADGKKDARALRFSCAMLTRALDHSGELETQQALYADCAPEIAETVIAARYTGEETKPTRNSGDWLPIVRVAPVYPGKALRNEQTGVVIFEFTISAQGRPEDIEILASTHKVFNKHATASLKKFRYKPRVIDGEAVDAVGAVVSISFALEGVPDQYCAEVDEGTVEAEPDTFSVLE